ncbi:MAG: aldehyde dehydrogenase family protein [Ostreibacterium sp.]
MDKLTVISPVDNSIYYQADWDTSDDIEATLTRAEKAQIHWKKTPLDERLCLLQTMVDYLVAEKATIIEEICYQMGRPISQAGSEVDGFQSRAKYMLSIADIALAPYEPTPMDGFSRYITREPLGVIAVLSPWNYPLLTSVNVIVPALAAGNAVILKPSAQTPLIAEHYLAAAKRAGLPTGVFQRLKLSHENTQALITDRRIDGVFFTGSVMAGKSVQSALNHKFIPCGLELGGKDAAYVRADADIEMSVENLVDGAFFNSGQSCCGIERIYVQQTIYQRFIDKFVEKTRSYKLGNPTHLETNLGPMVKTAAADFVRQQIQAACAQGARPLIDESLFPASQKNTPYLSPQVLVDVNHHMSVMKEESFGPVVGIMAVNDDQAAIELMNDSDYGLTASIWTNNLDIAKQLGEALQTGTVFLNRCDYLDPALAWTGIKSSGRGVTLSMMGYEQVTRVKSYHLRHRLL